MDRRPLGTALLAHGRRNRLACPRPVAPRARIARRLIVGLVLAAGVALAAWIVLRPSPQPPGPHTRARGLIVGVDDDTLKWTPDPLGVVRWQKQLGAHAVRVWVPWAGERRPQGARLDELDRAEQAARHTKVVLAVFGVARATPTTPVTQQRFCAYARRTLDLVPHARAVVVWNEANTRAYWSGTPEQYESLLARCYDALDRPGLTVLDSTASGHAPEAFLRRVAIAYRESGRTRPLVDAFGHNPYPRTADEPPDMVHPVGFVGVGDYTRFQSLLRSSFGRPYDIWYLEDGYQSAVPSHLAGHYDGRENVRTIGPELQAQRIANAIALAACQERVRAFFNFELVDETRLAGWQSGLVWRGVHRKPAAAAFARAAQQARAGCSTRP